MMLECFEVREPWLRVSNEAPRWVRAWGVDGRAFLVCVRQLTPQQQKAANSPIQQDPSATNSTVSPSGARSNGSAILLAAAAATSKCEDLYKSKPLSPA